MSVRVSEAVWERSASRGLARLVLLAIADHAKDDGTAFPSVTRLARMVRADRREVQRAMRRLEELGELVREPGGGRQRNTYRVRLPPAGPAPAGSSPVVPAPLVSEPLQQRGRHQRAGGAGTALSVNEPSSNHQKELTLSSPHGDRPRAEKLVELWNGTVTQLPKVEKLSGQRRQKALRRLREHPDLAWWEKVFRAADADAFMCGDNDRGWRASFDFFVKNDTNALSLLEREAAPAARRAGEPRYDEGAVDRLKAQRAEHLAREGRTENG